MLRVIYLPILTLVFDGPATVVVVAAANADTTASATSEQAAFFESRIRPVLAERCLDCHSGDEPESGLDLSTREGMLLGGKLGTALQPGEPARSLLISAIRHDEFIKMPPKEKLPTRQVVDFTRWVQNGAPWPDSPNVIPERVNQPSLSAAMPFTDEQQNHWSFQPIGDPKPPHIESDWPRSPLDQFVLDRLSATGLQPAPPADRRTLIRRAIYDLTGLPPSSDEVDAFLQDDSPEAFAKVVDRLLHSPRYGEHWGRHWLDVARYADTNGLDENLAYANAFRYRDYVISAFNSDKPWARFVQEQIAGDLLPDVDDYQENMNRFVATGFLALGPKMLAEDDPVKMQMDIIDEQLSTLCQTLMGLSIGCARCHDHKFDPLPTQDYYSLAGIFKSSKTMENHRVVAVWYERPLVAPAQMEQVAAAGQQIEALTKQLKELKDEVRKRDVQQMLDDLRATTPKHSVAMGVTEAAPQDLRIHRRGSHIALGEQVPRRFPRIIGRLGSSGIDPAGSGRLELAQWLTHPEHPLTARVIVNRVWHWRFGRGLVPSVDNFGLLGQPPTHPGLLDWLARRFLEDGDSLKNLHRMMMLSSTYQMSSEFTPAAAATDPDNDLLWRFRRRRLTAEEMRDSLISLGAGLDNAMGGTLLTLDNREYVTGTAGSELKDEFDNNRRSVYLPVVRSSVYDALQAFDFPDPATPTGKRQSSTVAPQALMLMNSELVEEHSLAMARRLLHLDSDRHRVEMAFQVALTRQPEPEEIGMALEYIDVARRTSVLASLEPDHAEFRSWQSWCRVLLSTNEFAYIE